MQQRASIVRALAQDPAVLLMDEPFGALDAFTRDEMNLLLQQLWMETGKTIVFVTHNISEAIFLADRVVVMSPRPGRVAQIFEIDLPRPRTIEMTFEPGFIAQIKEIKHAVEFGGRQAVEVRVSRGAAASSATRSRASTSPTRASTVRSTGPGSPRCRARGRRSRSPPSSGCSWSSSSSSRASSSGRTPRPTSCRSRPTSSRRSRRTSRAPRSTRSRSPPIEFLAGLAIGSIVGLSLAAVITQFPFVEKIITPYILLLVTTPMLALVPLLRPASLASGSEPRIIAVALASGPMVMINSATGFRRTDLAKIALARSFGAITLQIFTKIRFPLAMPMIIVGLMVGSIFGLLTAVGAEMVGGEREGGLGNRLTSTIRR